MMKKRSQKDIIIDSVIYSVLTVISLLCIAPIINTIAISFSDTAAASAGIVYFWPVRFTLASYKIMIAEGSFFRAFIVSVERVLLGGSINMLLVMMMAYPLSKEKKVFRQRNVFMWLVVVTMLFNGGLIPWYMTVKTVGLVDTIWSLVLPGAVPVFNLILLMNFYRGVPKELDEAATVDGAGPWYISFRIYVPVSLPALATITLFTVVWHWNDFFSGLIFINKPENYPLQTYIRQLVISLDYSKISDMNELKERLKVSNKTFNAAKIIVSMIPILCVYPFLQRYFVTGMVLGSIKE
jgi:putative aldouronate transport system permease protein